MSNIIKSNLNKNLKKNVKFYIKTLEYIKVSKR